MTTTSNHLEWYAFSFDCDLTFPRLLDRLNQLGPWVWNEADSAWYGNLARVRTETLRLDLIESGPNEIENGRVEAGNGQQFAISVRTNRSEPTPEEWSAVRTTLVETLLPGVRACGVTPTDTVD